MGVVAVCTSGEVALVQQPEPEPVAKPPQSFSPFYETMRANIEEGFPYLILPRETLDDFLASLNEHQLRPDSEQARKLFLLSTDFFVNDEDVSRPLKFQALYDPYISPCYNPIPIDA